MKKLKDDLQTIPRRFTLGICSVGAICSFCIFLVVLKVWNGPCGYDIFYYALQIRALSEAGALLFSDHSLVYGFLFLVNRIVKNPILTTRIVSSLSISAVYVCLLFISFRKGFSWYKVAAASIAVFNPATFYLLLEFTKNSFALALFFLAYLLLSNDDGRIRIDLKNRSRAVKSILGIIFLILTFFSHRIMFILIFFLIIHNTAAYLWQGIKESQYRKRIIIIGSVCVGIGLIVFLLITWNRISDRLPYFNITEPYHRIIQLSSNQLLPGERIFYLLTQISLFFLIPFITVKYKQLLNPVSVFAYMGWLFVFPFLAFSWDEIGFRLLILAPVITAPWVMQLKFPIINTVVGILFLVGCILFTLESAQNLADVKGPDYQSYAEEFENIEDLVRGRRVIAHRGLAGFLWYEKGIWSENFTPRTEQDSYLRIVFAFAPEIFDVYVNEGEPYPIALNSRYTLMEEYLWQRFYRDRGDLYFLTSELNPWQPRPQSGFIINRKIAELLSPVSVVSGP